MYLQKANSIQNLEIDQFLIDSNHAESNENQNIYIQNSFFFFFFYYLGDGGGLSFKQENRFININIHNDMTFINNTAGGDGKLLY